MTHRRFSYGKNDRKAEELIDLSAAPSYLVKERPDGPWVKLPNRLEDVEGLGDVIRALENK